MRKIIIGSILIILLLIAAFAYTVLASPTVKAQLHIESGTVMVNGNQVTNDVKLSEGDVIDTKNGKATVILHESILISLEPQTTVKLDDLARKNPSVKQTTGITWNTFMKLAGVEEFSIQTSNSVASVRGTGFQLSENKILTADGTVKYKHSGQEFTVTEMNVVEKQNTGMIERKANPAEIETVKKYFQKTMSELRHLRQLEMNKHPMVMNMIRKQYGLTDDMINQKLEEADNNKHDIDEVKSQIPINIQSVEKVARITKEIQSMNARLAAIN